MKNWKYINGAEVGNRNSKTGNATIKFYGETIDLTKESESNLKEILEELQMLHEGADEQRAIKEELKRRKTGNAIYSELNKDDKRVVIESDGSWYVYDKNGKIVEQGRESNSDNALGKFKAKGYNKKACNQDGVARMFEGLVKDEEKETEKNSGAIEELETGNYATGKSKLKPGDKVSIYGSKGVVKEIIGENTDNIYGEPLIKVELESGKIVTMGEHYCIKVGNSYTEADRKRLYELAKKQKTTKLTDAEWKEFQDLNKREEQASREMLKKTGNSASDDKFTYVMREFDEGKLKTPDGKVVTNPEQAKAIAYSESKKAENGLSRARMAMKV